MTSPMLIPDPVGPVHFSQARGVLVREPEGHDSHHSAVQSQFIVYTDTQKQTDALISRWTEIMQAAADKATEIINSV